jgi:transposase InsO family protein
VRIRQLQGLFGFTRQAYYQAFQRQTKEQVQETQIVDMVTNIRKAQPRLGGRKLYLLLEQEMKQKGIKIGRDAFFDILAANKLLVRRRKRKVMTTFSKHRFRKYPNLIRELIITRPNQVWVSDITYWLTQAGYLYISLVTDAYSRRIMGYEVAQSLEAIHSCHALQMALQTINKQVGKELIHHSDRGLQYCSNEYTKLLDSFDIAISMTENSDPLENAIAERVNGILKQEYLNHQPVTTIHQARSVLETAVFLYNYKRPHSSCDMLFPQQAHQRQGSIKRRWKNYYRKKEESTTLVNEEPD